MPIIDRVNKSCVSMTIFFTLKSAGVKNSSQVFFFFFFPNVDVCNLEYDICLQWDGFGLFLVIDMSMNTENRLSKVVSE